MAENLFKPVEGLKGVEIASAYPLSGEYPFFVDLIRMQPGASTAVHEQAGELCYRLTAVTMVSGLSLFENEGGTFEINDHVYLQPGDYLTRVRGFRHKFVNSCCEPIVIMKSLPPPDDCPLQNGGGQCLCRSSG